MDVEVKKNGKNAQLKDHEVKELIKQSQNGDQQARDLLIEKNMRLVWSVVQRFLNRGYEPDDLFQIGCIGLLKSVDKFDLTYDVRFSTYAVPMIIGEIQRFIRDDGTVKVSRSLKELGNKIRRAKDELSKTLGRVPTVQEIADHLEIEAEDVVLAQEAVRLRLRFTKPFMRMTEIRLPCLIKSLTTQKKNGLTRLPLKKRSAIWRKGKN